MRQPFLATVTITGSLAAIVAALSPPAAAEEPLRALPETVVTATRIPTALDRIAAGVTVIDRETIERRGYTTLAEALSAVPGVRLRSSGGPGAETLAFIRGAESRHTLVLLDGVPINDPSNPGGLFDFGKDSLGDVERIEVVRGPMSTLYGSGAVGGVINIITRRAGERRVVGSAQVGAGYPREAAGRVFAAGRAGMVDGAISAESLSRHGSNAIADRIALNTGERDGFRGQTGAARLGVQPAPWIRLDVHGRQRYATYGLDSSAFIAGAFRLYDDRNYAGRDRFGTYGGAVTLTPFGEALETRLSTVRSRYVRSFRDRADEFAASVVDDRYEGRRDTVAFDNTLRLPDLGPVTFAAVTFGAERRWEGLGTDTSFSRLDVTDRSDGFYAGLQGRLLRRLDLTGQMRREDGEEFGAADTWRVGAVLQLPELSGRIKAAYGTSFRAPDLYDRFGFGGNAALRPERGRSGEIGAEIDAKLFGRDDGATFAATWFSSRITDLIQYAGTFPTGRNENVGRAEIEGVEAVMTLRVAAWATLIGTYTYTDARNAQDDTRLLRRPEHAASASAQFSLGRFTVNPEVVFVGRYRDVLTADGGQSAGRGLSPSGVLANLSASYQVTDTLRLIALARNIGDSDFEPTNGFQTPGRSVFAGIAARW